jgi:hypothetical protein
MSLEDDLQPERKGPPKLLTLDIETSPLVVHRWSLYGDSPVSLNQLMETTRVICFAAKWYGEKKVLFFSEHHHGREAMVKAAWDLMNEAEIICTFNGPSFDIKHLQREFILSTPPLGPPSPFKNVDLLRTVRSQFKFASNKLQHVAQQLGLGSKFDHEGHALWTACMNGDDKAWGRMRSYAKQDVVLTEQLLDALGPWVKNFPHTGLYHGEDRACFRCGSTNLKQDGYTYTALTKYARLRCEDCGAWSRLNFRKGNTDTRSIT